MWTNRIEKKNVHVVTINRQILPVLLLPNTDHLQRVEKYIILSEVAFENWKRLFHKLVFDIGDNILDCFNPPSDSNAADSSLILFQGKWFLSMTSLIRRDNERRGMDVPWLSQGWLKSVFGLAAFLLVTKLSILVTVFKTAPVQVL